MAGHYSGMKVPIRPAPSLPVTHTNMLKQTCLENFVSDPFIPFKPGSIQEKKNPPPRPPPPRMFTTQVSNQRRSTFGSSKKKQQKAAATAIVKPLPPASNIPIGTLIDLRSPPTSPQFPTKLKSSLSMGNISSLANNTSLIESGFEDDFNSILSSSGATSPAFDPWSTNSDLTPSSSKTPSPDLMLPQHSLQRELRNKSARQIKNHSLRPTIICVPSTNKLKPVRPPPPMNANHSKIDNTFLSKEGSPPMPCIPPPPPPLEALECGPAVPPRPIQKDIISGKQPYCIAQFDYDSSHPDDLSFKAGDILALLSEVNGEWLRGRFSNKEGIFPQSYVKVIVPMAETSEFTNIRVIAIYPFTAETWDDLDLKEGDKILVLKRINKDWLYGECENKRGQFPECFVQDITDLVVDE